MNLTQKEIKKKRKSEKLRRQFINGTKDAIEWVKTAAIDDIKFAAERSTVNEAMKMLSSPHPYELHAYSPIMQGDYPAIEEYFEAVLEREADFGFLRNQEYIELSPPAEIPNAAFRSYEDGWTNSVREHWIELLQSDKYLLVKELSKMQFGFDR